MTYFLAIFPWVPQAPLNRNDDSLSQPLQVGDRIQDILGGSSQNWDPWLVTNVSTSPTLEGTPVQMANGL